VILLSSFYIIVFDFENIYITPATLDLHAIWAYDNIGKPEIVLKCEMFLEQSPSKKGILLRYADTPLKSKRTSAGKLK